MTFLQKITESSDEEVDTIINKAIEEVNKNAKRITRIGFLENGSANYLFQGFISKDTRIKYNGTLNIEDYSMQSTDFFYEFCHLIRKYKIDNKISLIYILEYFINNYFGYSVRNNRENIFNDIAWQNTKTDEEYFKALENNQIGYLKGKNAAQCTERSAIAQQILSMFGFITYYCIGCVDLERKQEPHCFNIVKRKDDYALIDYSIPIISYNQDGNIKSLYPFIELMTNEEFITKGKIKTFEDYYIHNNQKISTGNNRTYVIGEYQIDREKIKNKK